MRTWGVLTILSASMFIIVLDTTVMNVSISAIVRDLNTSVAGVQAAVALYALIMASFMLTGGKLIDLFGAKKVFLSGVILFGLGSFTAAFSQGLATLILGWSVIEGIGSALMMPSIHLLLRTSYEGKERAIGYSTLGAVAGVGAAVGPIVGGGLTTYYSWRYAFLGEVLIVIAILFFSFLLKKEILRKKAFEFDYFAMLLMFAGMASIVLSILFSPTYGLLFSKQPFLIAGFVIAPFGLSVVPFILSFGLIALYGLAKWENKRLSERKAVLFHLRHLRNEQLISGFSVRGLQMATSAGTLFAFPLFLQLTFNMSAIDSGVALIPFSLSLLVVAFAGAKLAEKMASKNIVQIGLSLSIVGLLTMATNVTLETTVRDMIPGSILLGGGLGLVASQIVNLVLSISSSKEISEVAGLNSTFEQLGNSVGIALIGGILVALLVANMSADISASEIIPDEFKLSLIARLEQDANLVSDSQLTAVLQEHGIDSYISREIVEANAKARLFSFKGAMALMSLFSVFGLIASTGLPKTKLVEG